MSAIRERARQREAEVMAMRDDGMTYRQIAVRIGGVSTKRAAQIYARALRRQREAQVA